MVTIYGRAFDVAPILGMLGMYKGFVDMERETAKIFREVDAKNGEKGVLRAVHMIYAMAIPCVPNDDCLYYAEGMRRDIVDELIRDAGQRGWHVILDSQLGRSDPVTQVKRMIEKGYLRHEHVHVALDPEFSSVPGRNTPGIPIGTVDAAEINRVQEIIDDYVSANKLTHRKILMVHQFGDPAVNDGVPFMIRNKSNLRRYPNVELVIDADGFGGPDAKISKYNRMTDSKVYPMIERRAIKLFYPNPYEEAHHHDTPLMDYDLVFGHRATQGGNRMETRPDVIVIA